MLMKFILILASLALSIAPTVLADWQTITPPESDSFFSPFVPPKPIPEIMNLKAGETIPPEVYEKYPLKQVALTIVYKKYAEDEEKEGEKIKHPAYDYFGGTEIQLAFQESIIASIAQRGFLNTHQVNSMEAVRRGRAALEDGFLGYHLDASFPPGASANVRPKSAYLSLLASNPEKNPWNKDSPDNHELSLAAYGNILAVFNDDIKNRTTFTMGDSVLSRPDKQGVRTLRFKSEKLLKMIPGEHYIEAQIWGPLTINDVHHFIVNCNMGRNAATNLPLGVISDAGLNELKKLDIPIFECSENRVGGRLIGVKKGKQLFPPPLPQSPNPPVEVGVDTVIDGASLPAQ